MKKFLILRVCFGFILVSERKMMSALVFVINVESSFILFLMPLAFQKIILLGILFILICKESYEGI